MQRNPEQTERPIIMTRGKIDFQKFGTVEVEMVRTDTAKRALEALHKRVDRLFLNHLKRIPEYDIVKEASKQTLRLPNSAKIKGLVIPDGYAVIGSAARALLLRSLEIDPQANARDIDMIRIVPKEPIPGLDHDLSEHYMSDDYARGNGVKVVDGVLANLSDADFTINEIVATEKYIYITRLGLNDTLAGKIRLTKNERAKLKKSDQAKDKLHLKALRFFAQSIASGKFLKLASLDRETFSKNKNYYPFWMILNLDKALCDSQESAKVYIELLKRNGELPEDLNDIDDTIEYLLGQLSYGFSLRSNDKVTILDEFKMPEIEQAEPVDKKIQKLEEMPKRRGFGKRH